MKNFCTSDTDTEMACSACRRVRRLKAPASAGVTAVGGKNVHQEEAREEEEGNSHFVLRNDSIMNWMNFIKLILVLQLLGNLNLVAAKRTRLCEYDKYMNFIHDYHVLRTVTVSVSI